MKTYSSILVACGLVASLNACGDDKSPGTGSDATTTSATDATATTATDATSNPTGNDATTTSNPTDATSPTDTTVTVNCDHNGFTAVDQQSTYDPDEGVPRYNAFSSTTTPVDILAFEFFPPVDGSSGDNPLDGMPGTIDVTEDPDDANYKTCETCVLVRQGCDDTGDCNKFFYAVAGELEVESVDYENLKIKGTAVGLKLQEVTIASDFQSTPVAGGEGWCIDSFAFETDPECLENEDCVEAGKGICDTDTFTCVACQSSFDCAAANPVCTLDENDTPVCVAKIDDCTDDDASEPSDAPAQATAITAGTPFDGKSCTGATESELDWFTITTAGETNLKATVTWAAEDVTFFAAILDDEGVEVSEAIRSTANLDEVVVPFAPAGKYYVVVIPSDTSSVGGGGTAVPYTLNVKADAPECNEDNAETACAATSEVCDVDYGECVVCRAGTFEGYFDCKTAATPNCVVGDDGAPACVSTDLCTGDDAPDADDGPSAATTIAVPSTTNAKICGENGEPSGAEGDWYKFTLAATDDVEFALSWTGATIDLDFAVFSATGELIDSGATETGNPESVELNGLEAGDYYVLVLSYAGTGTTAAPYTLTATLP